MSIVEFDKPSSWSLDAGKTRESTKCQWVGVVGGTAGAISSPPLHPHAVNPTPPCCRPLFFREIVDVVR